MSSVDIRVDLPSYSRTFAVKVPPSSTISQVKQEINRTCPGQPRPDGQRLIWRGRVLLDNENIDNLWKAEPRIVHLAVHPSAWTSLPPEIPPLQYQPQTQQQPPPSTAYESSPPYLNPERYNSSSPSNLPAYPTRLQPVPRLELEFVFDKHRQALHRLSSSIPQYVGLGDPHVTRNAALHALERNGWVWPAIFDQEFPAQSEGGLKYTVTTLDSQPYLQLSPDSEGAQPTPAQEHALRVLSFTFSILSLTLSPTPTARTQQQPQSIPVPPHVNQLLQQLGLPPLRPVENNPGANQNNRPLPEIRQIPIRPLLAPFIMLILRTVLLLYFVAPARKPIFGILILGWMLYEIWQPIRNGLRNARGGPPQNRQQPANNGPNAQQRAPNPGQPNAGQVPERAAAPNVPGQPGPRVPMTVEQQAGALFEDLATMNIADEETLLHWPATEGPAPEPTFGKKIVTFVSLFVLTLYPAFWNRRRTSLRRRETTIRAEANIRDLDTSPLDSSTPAATQATQTIERVRAEIVRCPAWIQRYMDRVVAEDWVDDSD